MKNPFHLKVLIHILNMNIPILNMNIPFHKANEQMSFQVSLI